MGNTLSVDFMCMYKEMPASLHTGVREDFCLLVACGTPWTRNLVMVNTLSVEFMYMYKEMPVSLHTGVWEDFCLLDKYSHSMEHNFHD